MDVTATTAPPLECDADVLALTLVRDEPVPSELDPDGALQALVERGEARPGPRKVAVGHSGGRTVLLVGVGARDELGDERWREAGAQAARRAGELGARSLCCVAPTAAAAEPLTEGAILGAYRFDHYKTTGADDRPKLGRILVSCPDDAAHATVDVAAAVTTSVNRARDLQNLAGNDLTPTALADHAKAIAGVRCEVEGRDGLLARGMGAFAAVAQGSEQEPALITLRYKGPGAIGSTLGLVGKAVTFDTGGISIKPAGKMEEMKFDMSGGSAVVEAVAAIAALQLPVNLVAVIGATENMPDGRAVKPGDVVRSGAGLTIEVDNTDAEGRLVLADCLWHARELGAERLIDLATLTGAIVTTFGSSFAGLFSNNDALADAIVDAGEHTGELVWRLPLHREYAKKLDGRYADLRNVPGDRKAGSITAAEFLKRFVGDVPWAHLDIAGTAWDLGRPYAPRGASGFGVRLLVELARAHGAE